MQRKVRDGKGLNALMRTVLLPAATLPADETAAAASLDADPHEAPFRAAFFRHQSADLVAGIFVDGDHDAGSKSPLWGMARKVNPTKWTGSK